MKKIKLGEICSIIKGSTGIQKATPGKFPLVVTAETRLTSNEFQFDNKAVCIPLVSSTGHGHASLKRIHYQEGKFALGNILAAVIPNDEMQLNTEYLYHYLLFYKDEKIVPLMKGAANVSLTINSIKTIEIDVPNIETQLEIVKSINNIKNTNNLLNDKILEQEEYVHELRKSVLQKAVEGKLVPQYPDEEPASELLKKIKVKKGKWIKEGKIKKEKSLPQIKENETPYVLPNGWMWCNLNDLAINIHYGYNGSANFNLKTPKLLRITDIQNNNVDWQTVPACDIATNTIETYKLQNNDILIARTGGTIGKSYIVENLEYNAVFASYLIRVIPALNSNSKYIKLFIESPLYWTQLIEKASGTGQPNVNGTSLKSLILPLPPLEEQKRIVEKVDELMKLCDELEEQINQSRQHSEQLIQSILQETFNHQVQSNVINITDAINRRAIFRAHVISKFQKDNNFGAIKCEKLTFLPEKIFELSLGGNYEKQAAGPLDNDAKIKVDEIFKKLKWVNVIEGNTTQSTKYIPDTNFAEHEKLFNLCFGDRKTEIDNLLNLFKNKNSTECEAVATLYAVWNDLLIDKKASSQEDIIKGFYKWSDKKKNFNRQDLYDNLAWMKMHNLIPVGKGKKTISKAKQMALI